MRIKTENQWALDAQATGQSLSLVVWEPGGSMWTDSERNVRLSPEGESQLLALLLQRERSAE